MLNSCKTIGNGENTKVWTKSWLPRLDERKLIPKSSVTLRNEDLTVCDLLENNKWNIDKIKDLSDSNTMTNILKIHLPGQVGRDEFIWTKSKSGAHTAKFVCQVMWTLSFIKEMNSFGTNSEVVNSMID